MAAEIIRTRTPHRGWCRVVVATLRGADGTEFDREIEDHGDAVAVLPYDPERRLVLLVRLLRAPVLLGGGGESLEAPAGLRENGDAQEAARREALEEVGLRLGPLEPVARAWTAPGISTERMDLFLAAFSTSDRVGAGGGLAAENENITVVEMPLAELWAGIGDGTVSDMKTILLTFALKERRPELFEGAGA